LEFGADTKKVNLDGLTPSDIAIMEDHKDLKIIMS
jgi:hypothetical protein